jgi:4-hydroxy-tetrahydrodipicolinate synthase
MSHLPFSGVITAIITPFLQNGDVDYKTFHSLLERQKASGIHGVVILGTTGENPTLTEDESKKCVLAALEHKSENFHIYAGTGTNDTKQTIEKSKMVLMLKSGQNSVDGIMVVTPYYNKPNQKHLIQHFHSVFSAIPNTPTCVYNVPGRTGINMLPQTFAEIAKQNPNCVAIKEAAGNVNAIAEMRLSLNEIGKNEIQILSGDDATFMPALLCGANGVISVTTNLIPKPMLEILQAFKNNNIAKMQELHLNTYVINSGIFAVPNPVGIKYAMSKYNLCLNTLRAPLFPTDESEEKILNTMIQKLEKVVKICP